MVSSSGGLPPRNRPGASACRRSAAGDKFVRGNSNSPPDGGEGVGENNNNNSKYLHLVIPSNLRPGAHDEERDRAAEEANDNDGAFSVARSGHTLDRFGDMFGDDDDEVEEEVEEKKEEMKVAEEKYDEMAGADYEADEADVMYDDEGNRIEFLYDDEGNRIEKVREDDAIIWQQEEEEEDEGEGEEYASSSREGLPPLAPPPPRSATVRRGDIRERFNQTGQCWRQKNHQQHQEAQKQRILNLSDSESSEEEEVFEPPQPMTPAVVSPQRKQRGRVRFAEVVDTKVFFQEEVDREEDDAEEEEQEKFQQQMRDGLAEVRRLALEGYNEGAEEVSDDDDDADSVVYNTCNFDEDDSVLDGETLDFSYSRGSTDTTGDNALPAAEAAWGQPSQEAYELQPPKQAHGNIDGSDEAEEEVGGSFYFLDDSPRSADRPIQTAVKVQLRSPPSARAPTDLRNVYDGNVGDVDSILDDLRGSEPEKKGANANASGEGGDEHEHVNTPVDEEFEDTPVISREPSASLTERNCMKLNDDVLQSYQVMEEREGQTLELENKQNAAVPEKPKKAPKDLFSPRHFKLPDAMTNPRSPYRHGHSLGDEVSDIFSEKSSLGPWAASKEMDGYKHHQISRGSFPNHGIESHDRRGLDQNSDRNNSKTNVLPGWIKPDLSLEDSIDDPLVGKMLTISPRSNSSMPVENSSMPCEEHEEYDDATDKAKRRAWPFGKKKKNKEVRADKKMHRIHHRHLTYEQREPQVLFDADRCEVEDDLQQHYFRGDPEIYQRQIEEDSVRHHMTADYAARELIQREQQRRQDMFRQEMETRAREEEEALRQEEAAVLQAINSGIQDNLMAVLSSVSQRAPETGGHDNHHPSQQKSPTLLENFLQGTMELCSSENVKYVEGKAKKIAEVLRDAFEDERDHGSHEADSHPNFVVDETGVYLPTNNHHPRYGYA